MNQINPFSGETFIGGGTKGLNPVDWKMVDDQIICRVSRESVRFVFLICFLFGPLLTGLFLSGSTNFGHLPIFGKFLALGMNLAAWWGLYTDLFHKRRIVFDASAGTIEFFTGKSSSLKLQKNEIVSFDFQQVERILTQSVPNGGYSNTPYTAYLFSANLHPQGQVGFVESGNQAMIKAIYEEVQKKFMKIL